MAADSPPIKAPDIPRTSSRLMVWNGPSNRHQKCLTWSLREAPQKEGPFHGEDYHGGFGFGQVDLSSSRHRRKRESLGASHITAIAGSALLSEPSSLLGRSGGLCECTSLGTRDRGAGPLCPHDAASLR